MKADSDLNREKATRLIDYLIKLASLQTKTIRDIDEYSQILWIKDIPHKKGCFTQAWGPNSEYDEDIWIEVQLPNEPILPSVPPICSEWIDLVKIHETSHNPELLESIIRQIVNPQWAEGSDSPEFINQTIQLEDHKEVQLVWANYLEQKWIPWAELHKDWESIFNTYSILFSMNQTLLKQGEDFDIILGLGLLSWQTPSNQHVRRHLIIANSQLEFEAKLRKFTIHMHPDGAKLRPELDMLDLEEQPIQIEEFEKNELNKITDNPWEKNIIDNSLERLAHSISPNGEYYSRLDCIKKSFSSKPIVEFAPALIMRKRSTKGLTDVLIHIKALILKHGIIPNEFADLAEVLSSDERNSSEKEEPESAQIEELYFPKLYNDEQLRIVEKLRNATGVLVQGPPGTGKSHTIANLICHLLATNKRILITAKTPRALKVLAGLLPPNILPLCISLLGSGVEENRSLGSSVNKITQKKDQWNENKSQIKINKLEKTLHDCNEEKARIGTRLRAIREAEIHIQSVGDGAYIGTAAQIAQLLKIDEEKYGWLVDHIPYNVQFPFNDIDFKRLLNNLRLLTLEKRKELKGFLPSSLPSIEQIKALFTKEQTAREYDEKINTKSHEEDIEKLLLLKKDSIISIKEQLHGLLEEINRINSNLFKWIPDTLKEAFTSKLGVLKLLQKNCEQIVQNIAPIIHKADTAEIVLSNTHGRKSTLEDAIALKSYLLNGGKIGWGPFKSKLVKSLQYLIKEVKLNGRLCKDLKSILDLIDILNVQIEIENGWKSWSGKADRVRGPYSIQYKTLESYSIILADIISFEKKVTKTKELLNNLGHPVKPIWHDESSLDSIIRTCAQALAKLNLSDAQNEIADIENNFSLLLVKPNVHPIVKLFFESINKRDFEQYSILLLRFNQLEKEKQIADWIYSTVNNIKNHTPELIKGLMKDVQNQGWEIKLSSFREAWRWSQARSWLTDYINKDDYVSISQRYSQLEDEVRTFTAEIASERAWSFCFQNMTDEHQRFMVAWQQEMKKLGKGTGKHASRHRREAQKFLNLCRSAVPAWVMPLHRVWDTVEPSPKMFDVIIVDEASQCGFESLSLLYLGKQILIVGDDKQISPEAIGIPENSIFRIMNDYLFDFKFRASFAPTQSLFEQGKLRFGTRKVVLREHFRCMPEIIKFSNDLCYSDTPLVPLRQFPPDRLTPLIHVYIECGYREGTDSHVINRPEAEAIVNKIEELCQDKIYESKSMGVIVLQGEAQAGLIEGLLLERIGAEVMANHNLLCGNPYSFQGDERDIIFLSMVAAPNERIGSLVKSADERRFNVAASRARDQMWLFHSVTRADLSKDCYRYKLLEFFEETKQIEINGLKINELIQFSNQSNRAIVKPPVPFDSWFEVDVAIEIANRGYQVIPQYEFAGKRIDLVIQGENGLRHAVECDGDQFHGSDEYDHDMNRQRMLERCGWVFYRIRAASFYANKQTALSKLWQVLEERNIYPQKSKCDSNDSQSKEQDARNDRKNEAKTDSQNYEYSEAKRPDTKNIQPITEAQKSILLKKTEGSIPESFIQHKYVKGSTVHNSAVVTGSERSLFPEYSTKMIFKDVLTKYIPKANYSHSDCKEYYSIHIGNRGPYMKCAVCSKSESISPVFIKSALDELKILCPKCKHAVKVKSNQKGGYFIGCSQYPKCSGLIPWLQLQKYIQKISNETS